MGMFANVFASAWNVINVTLQEILSTPQKHGAHSKPAGIFPGSLPWPG